MFIQDGAASLKSAHIAVQYKGSTGGSNPLSLGSNPSAVTCLCIILTKYEWN